MFDKQSYNDIWLQTTDSNTLDAAGWIVMLFQYVSFRDMWINNKMIWTKQKSYFVK